MPLPVIGAGLGTAIAGGIGAIGNVIGGWMGQESAEDAARENARLQRQYAQHGIKWRVKDAIDAGIHPLYALGAQTHSFSPSSVGSSSMGQGIAAAGQDLGRALGATMTTPEKLSAFEIARQALILEGGALDNQIKATQLARARQLMASPSFPSSEEELRAFGKSWSRNPGFMDAQTGENRYGELSDFIFGPAALYGDYQQAIAGRAPRTLFDNMARDRADVSTMTKVFRAYLGRMLGD